MRSSLAAHYILDPQALTPATCRPPGGPNGGPPGGPKGFGPHPYPPVPAGGHTSQQPNTVVVENTVVVPIVMLEQVLGAVDSGGIAVTG